MAVGGKHSGHAPLGGQARGAHQDEGGAAPSGAVASRLSRCLPRRVRRVWRGEPVCWCSNVLLLPNTPAIAPAAVLLLLVGGPPSPPPPRTAPHDNTPCRRGTCPPLRSLRTRPRSRGAGGACGPRRRQPGPSVGWPPNGPPPTATERVVVATPITVPTRPFARRRATAVAHRRVARTGIVAAVATLSRTTGPTHGRERRRRG